MDDLPPRDPPSAEEGDDPQREPLSQLVEQAESVDLVREDSASEVLDAVDDNTQEPPQTADDDDEAGVAEPT